MRSRTRWSRPADAEGNSSSDPWVLVTMATIPADLTRHTFSVVNAVAAPLIRSGLGNPLLLGAGPVALETTGRRSGLRRTVPLLATRAGNRLTVSTLRSDSQWLRNIETDERVAVWLFGRRREATATVTRGPLNTVRVELRSAA